MRHLAGTVPIRPLQIGDVITYNGARREETVTGEHSHTLRLEDALGCLRWVARETAGRIPAEGQEVKA